MNRLIDMCKHGNDVEVMWQLSLDLMISIQALKFAS